MSRQRGMRPLYFQYHGRAHFCLAQKYLFFKIPLLKIAPIHSLSIFALLGTSFWAAACSTRRAVSFKQRNNLQKLTALILLRAPGHPLYLLRSVSLLSLPQFRGEWVRSEQPETLNLEPVGGRQ